MASPARYTFQKHVYRELGSILEDSDRRILDFGSGPGTFRFYFSNRQYYGFDIADMGYGEKKGQGVDFVVADGTRVPFMDGSFDFVFCNAVLEHVVDNHSAAREAARVLKAGKYCLIVVPTKLSIIYDEIPFIPLRLLGLHGHADHYYSKRELIAMVERAGMKAERTYHSMGFFSSMLKTAYIYARLPRFIFYSVLSKITKRENGKRDLYADSLVKQATSREDLRRIHENEYASRNPIRWAYQKMLEACFFLDDKLPLNAGGEWMVVARKVLPEKRSRLSP